MEIQSHPAADVFPLMSPEEYSGLLSSMRDLGQLDPIGLYEGQILDGRNRHRACLELSQEPIFEDLTGKIPDPIAYVAAKNLGRRSLTLVQRAKIGVKLAALYSEEIASGKLWIKQLCAIRIDNQKKKVTQKSPGGTESSGVEGNKTQKKVTQNGPGTNGSGLSVQRAADEVGVGKNTIRRMRVVVDQGCDEVQEAVDKEVVGIKEGAELSSLPKQEQVAALQEAIAAKESRKSKEAVTDGGKDAGKEPVDKGKKPIEDKDLGAYLRKRWQYIPTSEQVKIVEFVESKSEAVRGLLFAKSPTLDDLLKDWPERRKMMVLKWFKHREEVGDKIKPTYAKTAVNQIKNRITAYGEKAVTAKIDEAILKNWKSFDYFDGMSTNGTRDGFEDLDLGLMPVPEVSK